MISVNKKFFLVFIPLLLGSCVTVPKILTGERNLDQLHFGMQQREVLRIAGKPDHVDERDNHISVYYYSKNIFADCSKAPNKCTPVVIEGGRVVAVGHKQKISWGKKGAGHADAFLIKGDEGYIAIDADERKDNGLCKYKWIRPVL